MKLTSCVIVICILLLSALLALIGLLIVATEQPDGLIERFHVSSTVAGSSTVAVASTDASAASRPTISVSNATSRTLKTTNETSSSPRTTTTNTTTTTTTTMTTTTTTTTTSATSPAASTSLATPEKAIVFSVDAQNASLLDAPTVAEETSTSPAATTIAAIDERSNAPAIVELHAYSNGFRLDAPKAKTMSVGVKGGDTFFVATADGNLSFFSFPTLQPSASIQLDRPIHRLAFLDLEYAAVLDARNASLTIIDSVDGRSIVSTPLDFTPHDLATADSLVRAKIIGAQSFVRSVFCSCRFSSQVAARAARRAAPASRSTFLTRD